MHEQRASSHAHPAQNKFVQVAKPTACPGSINRFRLELCHTPPRKVHSFDITPPPVRCALSITGSIVLVWRGTGHLRDLDIPLNWLEHSTVALDMFMETDDPPTVSMTCELALDELGDRITTHSIGPRCLTFGLGMARSQYVLHQRDWVTDTIHLEDGYWDAETDCVKAQAAADEWRRKDRAKRQAEGIGP